MIVIPRNLQQIGDHARFGVLRKNWVIIFVLIHPLEVASGRTGHLQNGGQAPLSHLLQRGILIRLAVFLGDFIPFFCNIVDALFAQTLPQPQLLRRIGFEIRLFHSLLSVGRLGNVMRKSVLFVSRAAFDFHHLALQQKIPLDIHSPNTVGGLPAVDNGEIPQAQNCSVDLIILTDYDNSVIFIPEIFRLLANGVVDAVVHRFLAHIEPQVHTQQAVSLQILQFLQRLGGNIHNRRILIFQIIVPAVQAQNAIIRIKFAAIHNLHLGFDIRPEIKFQIIRTENFFIAFFDLIALSFVFRLIGGKKYNADLPVVPHLALGVSISGNHLFAESLYPMGIDRFDGF